MRDTGDVYGKWHTRPDSARNDLSERRQRIMWGKGHRKKWHCENSRVAPAGAGEVARVAGVMQGLLSSTIARSSHAAGRGR